MKKITTRLFNLTPGTVICRQSGEIVLTSGYDSFHGWYEYADGYVTPADLIGDEYDPDTVSEPKEVSLDNGRHWLDPQMVLELDDDEIAELDRLWDALAAVMDDETRETVAADVAPCSKQEFLAEYLRRAPHDLCI